MENEQLIGRYRVIEELGRGGSGTVYHGKDPILERDVAIKVLHPRKFVKKASLQRFLREARIAARLDHPCIIKIFDIGEVEGVYHIVMEYAAGEALRDALLRRQELPGDGLDVMVQYFWQICHAFDYAHEMKIIHRDIKPENIMITPDGRIKVMDLGLAVLVDSNSLTEVGDVLGTFSYISPEQAKGERADARSDIYSLGILFFEMLTGRLPFVASSPSEMIQKHLYERSRHARELNPAIPALLDVIIERALRKLPAERYQSVKDILADLSRCMEERQLPAPDVSYLRQAASEQSPARGEGELHERGEDAPAPAPGELTRTGAYLTEEMPHHDAALAPPPPGRGYLAQEVPTYSPQAFMTQEMPRYSSIPLTSPGEGAETFTGVAGELYHSYQRQQRQHWKIPLLILAAVLVLLAADALMVRFFKVSSVTGAYWSEDGKEIVYTKAMGHALDYATDLDYPQLGGDDLWVYRLASGKKEKLVGSDYNGRLAPYQGCIEGNIIWMVRQGKDSQVVVFPLQDKTAVLTWKFEGPGTDLLAARGKKALVCRDRGDVGLIEMGEDPVFVFHSFGPYTVRDPGMAGMTTMGARVFFAQRTPKATNIYVWDKHYGQSFKLAETTSTLAALSNDALGKYPTYVVRFAGEAELWLGDTVSGQIRTLYKSKNGYQAFRWAPDGSVLAFASLSKILFFTAKDTAPRAQYDVLGVRSLAFAPGGSALYYSVGTTLNTIALRTGAMEKLPVEIPPYAALDFSPDGSKLMLRTALEAGGSRFGIYVMDCATGALQKVEGASLSHRIASFFGYRLYAAIRNFLTGRKRKS